MSQAHNGIERRRFIRHPICFPLKYKVSKKGLAQEESSTTINVSQGGLLFSAKRPVDINSLVAIRIPFQDKIFNVQAKVVHCRRSPEAKLYNIGVCFQRFADAFKVKLIEQMYLIMEYRDLRSMQLGREISLQEASREWIKRYSKRFNRLYWIGS
ncbi:MAG: PilZ domain-containing protein [Candidatus Omnitrophica bacterium]|nr:PilZ domain-containing protein [Candidatus Omnitrophota bacterium]